MKAPTHRHKKRGTEYVLMFYGNMQSSTWHEDGQSVYMREVAIYHSALYPEKIWVRPIEDFEERFEEL